VENKEVLHQVGEEIKNMTESMEENMLVQGEEAGDEDKEVLGW
jgi:hypothetical protein